MRRNMKQDNQDGNEVEKTRSRGKIDVNTFFIVLVITFCVVLVLGTFLGMWIEKQNISSTEIGSCKVKKNGDAFYEIPYGYYANEKNEIILVWGGLAIDQNHQDLMLEIEVSCNIPAYLYSRTKRIPQGNLIADTQGNTYVVFTAYYASEEVTPEVETPLP
ncbi:hypothetical protein K0B04_00995 [Patescibacteria group bacterium]|nr:hypothetical protein [Patescibacteria group bacterium]